MTFTIADPKQYPLLALSGIIVKDGIMPFSEVQRAFTADERRAWRKWIEGQTSTTDGYYASDAERFLAGRLR